MHFEFKREIFEFLEGTLSLQDFCISARSANLAWSSEILRYLAQKLSFKFEPLICNSNGYQFYMARMPGILSGAQPSRCATMPPSNSSSLTAKPDAQVPSAYAYSPSAHKLTPSEHFLTLLFHPNLRN